MLPLRARALALALLSASAAALAQSAPADFAALLGEMHPEYGAFVREVRRGGTRLHPFGMLAGLVRPGGADPRDPRDAPRSGAGERNDILVYDDTFAPGSSEAWRRLIVDHEYFHARHLAQAVEAPAVDFGDAQANRHYYEALAWQYNLERIEHSRYPGLSAQEKRLAGSRYLRHRAAFETWLRKDHAQAWQHYGRFFPPGGRPSEQ